MSSKYILAIFLNIAPFLLSCLLYESGLVILLLFSVFQLMIGLLNYKWTNKVISNLFLNLMMLTSSIVSIKIITQSYYNNISSDTGTLAVGNFAVWACFVFISLLMLISITIRIVSKRFVENNDLNG